MLAEEERCSCSSSWGHGKLLSKRPIPEKLYAVFDEVGKNNVTEYRNTILHKKKYKTAVTNAASSQIKNSRPTPCSLPGSKKSDIRK